MAGPQQFSTSGPAHAARPKRRFTLELANRSLPLVKRVVADIVRTHADAAKARQDIERQPLGGGANKGHRVQDAQSRLDSSLSRLEDYLDELNEIGCELKDFQSGLIDFVGRHQGRDVYLCWKLGEEKIAYWHELDAGFAGRQPVSKLREE